MANLKETPIAEWKFEDMVAYAEEQGEKEWLKELVNTKVKHKVYPKVESVSKSGKKSWKADKTAEPTIKEVDITFVEVKKQFNKKFGLYEAKTKDKPKSMKDYF